MLGHAFGTRAAINPQVTGLRLWVPNTALPGTLDFLDPLRHHRTMQTLLGDARRGPSP